ncbi:protein chromatin remodeling 4 [Phtheirospermum japonicum]|uniref:Protein chromatin remodeling 4 n=1 Tax=Phtheirospermum japonicum TaxID=374723 RepID=A0A830CUM7_9LAMI|nr:protein chromatin remodeling 4 [Phtheirospermum japonicum]
MEPTVVGTKSRRGRKRKRNNEDNAISNGVKTRSLRLVNRYVQKEFQGSGVFLGRITLYNSGLYRVNYEDGDFEDLDGSEVKAFLVDDSDLTGKWLERKKKLDEMLLSKDVKAKVQKVDNEQETENSNLIDSRVDEVVKGDCDGNSDIVPDCLSDSCEDTQEGDADVDVEVPLVPPPELPPSSGHMDVPEECVSHLLSVYSFLRSFSVPLFLYPFELDDFVGALNCSVVNTLLDSVHVALLRVLKRHLERLSSDGSELASKCLRCLDWSLLDTLTWPIYLAHYLMLMGDRKGQDWKGFYIHSLERDYYSLSAGKKLVVMQILCEGVLDSEELRLELDSREESEVGIDIDSDTMVNTAIKPRRTHHGYSKTSSSKDVKAMHGVAEIKSALGTPSMESGVGVPAESSIDGDGNGDECRLCGMDGLLVCCDGCPSSYHSRCLGLSKMFMPDGSWYCPDCKINATEPKVLRGTALRGGEVLGVDPYEQVFVASCDHLLVYVPSTLLKASINSESCLRYYNRHDIPGVLHALYSKQDHVIAFSEICRGIMQYWELPQSILPCNEMSKVGLQSAHTEGISECSTKLVKLPDKVPDMSALCHTNCDQKPVLSESSLDMVTKSDSHMDSSIPQSGFIITTPKTEPAFSSLIGQPADACQISQQSNSCVTETIPYVSRSSTIKYSCPLNDISLEPKASIPCQELNNKVERNGSRSDCCFYRGSSFKPTGYINYYVHGDFAAAAAANLAVLSPEDNQVVSSSLVKHRKVLSASVALQVKAFSSGGTRFFWPNTEKKIVEVPRERCGWCFSCKSHVSSKKGCLLNAAASNATRGSIKVLAGLRPVKNGDGRLHGIAAYILFMEESLSGLLSGPFLNDTFKKQWRKQVGLAASCGAIKINLLELEENIRAIALSGDWPKIVEGSSTQSSTSQTAASVAGSTQKRKPGRRGKKPSASVEVVVEDYVNKPADFTWWRGGRLSKLMIRRGILPYSVIRKSARQGGSKEIMGIHYVEGNDTPKSSKQLAWRSAVEMSRNTAHLALQVRYLDFHVRWGDLVRPEQSNSEGKGPEAEAHAFRNAFICDKKIVGHEIRYSVAFGSQKHLPSRIMKNIAEVEQIQGDGMERYWFSETYIPLYLIKEYEQKVEQNMPVSVLSKLRRGQLKVSRRNIFSDLFWKQNNLVRSCCACHQDLFYRNVVKCSECQGFCHEHCATSSTVNLSNELLITCKQCEAQATTQIQSSNGSPTSPLPLQIRDIPNPPTTTKRGKSAGYQGSSTALREHSSELKSSEVKSTNRSAVTKKHNKKMHWGLIWSKNNCESTGADFRSKNILPRGNPHAGSTKPICRLCAQPYNADLMYILCEVCKHWFHADAVQLDESKISLLMGFKCSKCRRSKSPICPYTDPKKKKALEERDRKLAAKYEVSEMGSEPGIFPELGQAYSASVTTAQVVIHDKSRIDHGENYNNAKVSGPGPGPKKLPVRRHVNQEKDASTDKLPVRRHKKRDTNLDCSNTAANDSFRVDPLEANDAFTPQSQWIYSGDNFDDGTVTLDFDSLICDDVEFEPQTYFSFNELLAPDDGGNGNENETLKISYDQEEPIISVETDHFQIVSCKICSNSDPCPDLCCLICGVWIHNGCSPWFESSSWEDGWRCGDCREWR